MLAGILAGILAEMLDEMLVGILAEMLDEMLADILVGICSSLILLTRATATTGSSLRRNCLLRKLARCWYFCFSNIRKTVSCTTWGRVSRRYDLGR